MKIEIKALLRILDPSTRISIENFNDILFSGLIAESDSWKDSNLEVIECEFKDNILYIQVVI